MEKIGIVDIGYFGLASTGAISSPPFTLPNSLATHTLVKESFPLVGIPFHLVLCDKLNSLYHWSLLLTQASPECLSCDWFLDSL